MKLSPLALASGIAIAALAFVNATANAQLINYSFEDPAVTPGSADYLLIDAGSVPGWSTTASDNMMEIWSDGFQGVTAYEGSQFVELNANLVSTLYQDTSLIPTGATIGYQFAHRGRDGADVMKMSATDLGVDGLFGTGDDTVLFTNTYSDSNDAWGFYSGTIPTTALGNNVRFSFESISSAGGQVSYGNFIDAANFGVGVGTTIPEAGTVALILPALGALGVVLARRKRN